MVETKNNLEVEGQRVQKGLLLLEPFLGEYRLVKVLSVTPEYIIIDRININRRGRYFLRTDFNPFKIMCTQLREFTFAQGEALDTKLISKTIKELKQHTHSDFLIRFRRDGTLVMYPTPFWGDFGQDTQGMVTPSEFKRWAKGHHYQLYPDSLNLAEWGEKRVKITDMMKKTQETRNSKGQLHSYSDQPAFIDTDGAKYWYNKGELHRGGDKPAVIELDDNKEYWKHGIRYSIEHYKPVKVVKYKRKRSVVRSHKRAKPKNMR